MASLNKLAIRGIRSFDDKQVSVIEFFSPVTVIVGHNGSGKTTIIECLKYATTGDQPPNTRGGAFVHDPKMANEKEVRAQVKLRFYAANGTRMLAVRNLSVTTKKTGLTMKTLENILAVADGNSDKPSKRGAISTKCAEIDAEIPHLLGVSKSVLENVIFCHQEDSYWPLAEPSALKKKFDDIFEATRYTKALDSIKALRKERVTDLKAERERLDGLARDKARADKLRASITEKQAAIEDLEARHELLRLEHSRVQAENRDFYDKATGFKEIFMVVNQKTERKQDLLNDLGRSREGFVERPESLEQLTEMIQDFSRNTDRQKREISRREAELNDEQDALKVARSTVTKLHEKQGELQGLANTQNDRKADREKLIKQLSKTYDIFGYDVDQLGDQRVIEFASKLTDKHDGLKSKFQSDDAEAATKIQQYESEIQRLQGDFVRLTASRDEKRDQIKRLQESISISEGELETSQELAATLHHMATSIADKSAQVATMRRNLESAQLDAKITEKEALAKELQANIERVNLEWRSLHDASDTRARFDVLTNELKSKQSAMANTIDINSVKFKKLVGVDAAAETMERDLDKAKLEKERQVADLEIASNTAKASLRDIQIALSKAREDLKGKREKLNTLKAKLREQLDGRTTVDEAIREATDEINLRQQTSGNMAGATHVYDSLLHEGRASKACPACTRKMSAQEHRAFEAAVNARKQKMGKGTEIDNEAELKEWEDRLDELQRLVSDEVARDQLKHDGDELERLIREQEALLPGASAEAEEAVSKLAAGKKELSELLALKQQASSISSMKEAIQTLQHQINRLQDDLKATGSIKGADEVQRELDDLQHSSRTANADRIVLTNEREHRRTNLAREEAELTSSKLREGELKNKVNGIISIEQSIRERKADVEKLFGQIREQDTRISEAQSPIRKIEQEGTQFKAAWRSDQQRRQRDIQDLAFQVEQLSQVNRRIQKYVQDGHERKLQRCEEEVQEAVSEVAQLEASVAEMRKALGAIEREIDQGGSTLANLRENVRLRQLKKEIDEVETEISGYDLEGAAVATAEFNTTWEGKKQREQHLHSQYASIGGQLGQMRSQLREAEEDLRDNFGTINKDYTDQLVKVKMSDMANNDLEKYSKALDNAIMKYHSLKMEEVNDSMRHLWNKTYQGTDIDGIKIASDSETSGTKRSYNYRVVMTKDQVEMDMRGRCSAGQKMLASIIIRLALSDSFGQNCGILALDEPTNALDTENVDALAESLIDIINERKNQGNFQLIVITHDENFLRKLGQSNVMEHYWRVSRDSRQKSIIEKHRFG